MRIRSRVPRLTPSPATRSESTPQQQTKIRRRTAWLIRAPVPIAGCRGSHGESSTSFWAFWIAASVGPLVPRNVALPAEALRAHPEWRFPQYRSQRRSSFGHSFSRDAVSALPQPNGIWCHQRMAGTGSASLAQVLLFDAPQPFKPIFTRVPLNHCILVLYSI